MKALVANPGVNPELTHLAAGLDRAGALHRYVAPFANGTTRSPVLVPVRGRLDRELDRRRVAEIDPARLASVCEADEIAVTAATRAGWPTGARALIAVRNGRFARATTRLLPGADALVGLALAARTAFERASVLRVLHAPATHPRDVLDLNERVGGVDLSAQEVRRLRAHAGILDAELALADVVTVLSSFAASMFEAAGVPRERLRVTTPGVDTEVFTPPASPAPGPPVVVYAGRLTAVKGIAVLLDAFREVPGDARLRLIGTATSLRLPRDPRVEVLGHMPRRALVEELRRAHLFVLPTWSDAFGLAALEAMAAGLPAVVTASSFAHDVIEDGVNGFVVEPGDVEALRERIARLVADPDLRVAMGRAARATAERLTWRRYGDEAARVVMDEWTRRVS